MFYLTSTYSFAREETMQSHYENWYQVEILVYKSLQNLSKDEIWSDYEVSYPREIISISKAQTRPNSLDQLKQLIVFPNKNSDKIEVFEPGETTFLFQQSSRQYRTQQLLEGEIKNEKYKNEISGFLKSNKVSTAFDHSQLDTIINAKTHEAYANLGDKELGLAGIARSLKRSSRYDLLIHQAWLQPITSTDTPILVQGGKRYDEVYEIDGTLTLSRKRYLHINADLWFTKFMPKYNHQEPTHIKDLEIDEETIKNFPTLVAQAMEKNTHEPSHPYRLLQSRRMRSDEMHYLDHPLFGLIVLVQRFNE